MNVLGLKVNYHDTGAALISKGRVVAISEERLNRVKHSLDMFPTLSIDYCLETLGIKAEDVDLIVMDQLYARDEVKTEDIFRHWPGAARFSKARIEVINHYDAHAASAFFSSPFEEAAVLVYDGNGEAYRDNRGHAAAETDAFFRGSGNTLSFIRRTTHAFDSREKGRERWPITWGVGWLYAYLSNEYCNLGVFNEGKLMGLAAYGDDRLLKQFPREQWCAEYMGDVVCNAHVYPGSQSAAAQVTRNRSKLLPAIGFKLRSYQSGIKRRLRALARKVDGSFRDPHIFPAIYLPQPKRKDEKLPDEHYASVAYLAQHVFEYGAALLGKKLKAATGSENLCVAGGCGLNIDANSRFLSEEGGGFKKIFVQPAASDSGIPLGAALYGYHVIGKMPRDWEMTSAALGRPYTEKEIIDAIEKFSDKVIARKSADVCAETAKLLADGNIIGWFHGGSEYGPRALGNRSILCDARRADAKDILNERVKHRELWRPFAASVLQDKMHELFDIKVPSPFMLLTANVLKEKQSVIPSLVHKDGTCRIQSVTTHSNKKYHDLLKAYDALTGVPAILNTSYNLGGDPIIESPQDALDTFTRTNIDYLILEDYVVMKRA